MLAATLSAPQRQTQRPHRPVAGKQAEGGVDFGLPIALARPVAIECEAGYRAEHYVHQRIVLSVVYLAHLCR